MVASLSFAWGCWVISMLGKAGTPAGCWIAQVWLWPLVELVAELALEVWFTLLGVALAEVIDEKPWEQV